MVRIERTQMTVDRHAPRRRNVRKRRLIGSLPGAKPRMALKRVDDLVEQRLMGQVGVDSRETDPELQAVRRSRVEFLSNRQDLFAHPTRPPHRLVPHETHPTAPALPPRTHTTL